MIATVYCVNKMAEQEQKRRHEVYSHKLQSIQEQIHLLSTRTVIESFSALESKHSLANKYKYALETTYQGMEEFVKLKNADFVRELNREDFIVLMGAREQFNGSEVTKILDAKLDQIFNYIARNSATFDICDNNLQKEVYDMSNQNIEKVQDCMAEIRGLHKLADSLLETLRTVERKITRSYHDVAILLLLRSNISVR